MASWDWIDYIIRAPSNFLTMGLGELAWHQRDVARDKAAADEETVKRILSGANSSNALDIQGQLANSGLKLNADQEKYLDNLIAQYNTNSAREWERNMSDTALLRNAEQLKELGLSNSSITSVGGASNNVVDTAGQVKSNMAQERYNQKMQNARAMISLAGSLASAGIHSAAISKVRNVSSVLASSAANSALHAEAVQNVRERMIREEAQRIYDSYK